MEKGIDKEEIERRKRNFKMFRIVMAIIDVLALIILFFQIKLEEVSYYSYVLLIICNILVFFINPNMEIKFKNKKDNNNSNK